MTATPPRSTRAATDMAAVDADLTAALKHVRERLQPTDDSADDAAICMLETAVVFLLKLASSTNPSKVRDIARTIEIKARLDGKPECLGVLTR